MFNLAEPTRPPNSLLNTLTVDDGKEKDKEGSRDLPDERFCQTNKAECIRSSNSMSTSLPPVNLEAAMSAGDAVNQSASTLTRKQLVSDELRVIMQYILYGVTLTIISGFGVVTGIINIICFVRQGLNDPVNVSLLGLAISDLGNLMTSLCIGICYNPTFQALGLPIVFVDVVYFAFAMPHFLFTGATAWFTALITLERCLCITKPIKVKRIVTPKRVKVFICCVFTLFTCTTSPIYYVSTLSWVFYPEQNTTLLSLIRTDDWAIAEQFSYSVNNGLIPFSAYFMIIICTVILASQLKNKAKWRKTCTTSDRMDNISKRDQKVAKMVMAISIMYIVCFSPTCISVISLILVPEMALALNGPNQNLLFIYGGISIVLENANSSANIFIYYHMSSRYKSTLKHVLRCTRTDHDKKKVLRALKYNV